MRHFDYLSKVVTMAAFAVASAMTLSYAPAASAADYPSKPVHIIVPFSAGGGIDVNMRALQPYLEKTLGEKIIIDNRPGSGGIVGHTLGAMAKPDGYTLTVVSTGIASGPWLYSGLRFTPESYDYIGLMSFVPNFLVVKQDSPFKTLKDFIDYAKAHPDELTVPYMNGWTSNDVADIILKKQSGIQTKVVHGFNSGAEDLASVLGGHTDYSFNNTSEILSNMKAGKIRALAVAAPKRSSFFPDIPTLDELGYKDDGGVFRALAAPKGTPEPVLKKLRAAFDQAMQMPGVEEAFKKVALTVDYMNAADTQKFIMDQYDQLGEIFKSLNIKKQKL